MTLITYPVYKPIVKFLIDRKYNQSSLEINEQFHFAGNYILEDFFFGQIITDKHFNQAETNIVNSVFNEPQIDSRMYRIEKFTILTQNFACNKAHIVRLDQNCLIEKSFLELHYLTSISTHLHSINLHYFFVRQKKLLNKVLFALMKSVSSDELFHQRDDSLHRISCQIYNRPPKHTIIAIFLCVQL